MCVSHFLFPVRIPVFYAESRSLYAKFSVLLSKWTCFDAEILLWECKLESRPVHLSWVLGGVEEFFFIVDQSGTKYHWVNPLPIFEHNYINVFEKYWCIKTVVLVRVITFIP